MSSIRWPVSLGWIMPPARLAAAVEPSDVAGKLHVVLHLVAAELPLENVTMAELLPVRFAAKDFALTALRGGPVLAVNGGKAGAPLVQGAVMEYATRDLHRERRRRGAATLVLLPDTQNYSEIARHSGHNPDRADVARSYFRNVLGTTTRSLMKEARTPAGN